MNGPLPIRLPASVHLSGDFSTTSLRTGAMLPSAVMLVKYGAGCSKVTCRVLSSIALTPRLSISCGSLAVSVGTAAELSSVAPLITPVTSEAYGDAVVGSRKRFQEYAKSLAVSGWPSLHLVSLSLNVIWVLSALNSQESAIAPSG